MPEQNKTIDKCKKCGGNNFLINEGLSHSAMIVDGTLEASKNVSNEIESVICKDCGEEYQPSDFNKIEFNY